MDTSVSQERPTPPDLWWSPTIGVWRYTARGPMLTPGFEMVNDPDGEHFREALPDDAVQLVPDRSITDLEQELYNRAVTAENDAQEVRALNSRLQLALEAARVPHEAPYVDGEHQGGNCIDVIMQEKAASHQLACENVDMQVRISTLTAEVERLRAALGRAS